MCKQLVAKELTALSTLGNKAKEKDKKKISRSNFAITKLIIMIHVRGTDIWIMISKKKNLDNNLSRIVFFPIAKIKMALNSVACPAFF